MNSVNVLVCLMSAEIIKLNTLTCIAKVAEPSEDIVGLVFLIDNALNKKAKLYYRHK